MYSVEPPPTLSSRFMELLIQWPPPLPLSPTATEHQRQISSVWPDVLRQAAQLAAQADLPVDEILNQVATHAPIPLAMELEGFHTDFEAGLPPVAALRNLADRCNVPVVADTIELIVAGIDRRFPPAPFLHAVLSWIENGGQLSA